MISYDKQKMLFKLDTESSSYVFGFMHGKFLTHLYWGKKISEFSGDYDDIFDFNKTRRTLSANDYPEYNISRDVIPSEFSSFGNTDLRTPTLNIEYADGSRITELEYVSHEIFGGKKKLKGLPAVYTESDSEAQTLEILLKDAFSAVEVILSYTVFEDYNAIIRSVRIGNGGDGKIKIHDTLSASVDFFNADYDFINLPGAWARERHPERTPLFHGKTEIESVRGASSAQQNPFFALVSKNCTETEGDAYGFNLIYSGNFKAGADVDAYDCTRAYIGLNPFNSSFVLESGEEFQTPEAVLIYSDEGLGKMSRAYHKLYRTRLCRGKFRDTERYVLINNWEATYFDFDEEKIVNIAKKASEVGVELMVLDDGWFGHRNNDLSSLGDWYVNESKLPNGLNSLVTKVNALGMKFGIWFEPEMVSPDSDCYRAHPDWCIHVNGRTRTMGRNQLMLDMSREDVCDYVYNSVADVLKSAPISYVKWDYNRNMTNIGSEKLDNEHQGEFYHRYILGLYSVLERLTTDFSDVLFESCSSGGARFDAGMLYYMPQTWCSDDTDAAERTLIQYGTSYCYPYSAMGAHVSAVPNHQVGRTTPFTSRGNVASCGQLGYELDLNKLNDYDISQVKEQIIRYKKYGEVFHKGDLYRLVSPFKEPYSANEFVSEDGNTVILVTFVIKATPNSVVRYIKLEGLDKDGKYRISGKEKVYSGEYLMNFGIKFVPQSDYDSEFTVIEKI